jgi:hypothetical protein
MIIDGKKCGEYRDTQRNKVYEAETVLHKYATPLPEMKDLERFAKKVWASRRMKKAFPKATSRFLAIGDGRGHTRFATGGWAGVDMPRFARNTHIMLHELAHVVDQRENGSQWGGHGWRYCAVYLKMVLYVFGREAHNELKASFKKHRVRIRPKTKRNMSEEQRAALRLRMAAAREARAA